MSAAAPAARDLLSEYLSTAVQEALEGTMKTTEVDSELLANINSAIEQQLDEHASLFASKTKPKTTTRAAAEDSVRCCALTLKDGAPVRCTRKRNTKEGGDYCLTHQKQCAVYSLNGDRPKYGRFDEEVPLTFTQYEGGVIVKECVPIAWTTPELLERLAEEDLPIKRTGKRGRRPKSESDAASTASSKSKKPPTGYNLFVKEHMKKGGTVTIKEVGEMWKALDDDARLVYLQRAADLGGKPIAKDGDSASTTSSGPKRKNRKNKVSGYKLYKNDNADRFKGRTAEEIRKAFDEEPAEVKKEFEQRALQFNIECGLVSPTKASAAPKSKPAPITRPPATPDLPPTPEAETPEAEEPAVASKCASSAAPIEVDLNGEVDAFCEDDDEDEQDFDAMPEWIHKTTKQTFKVDLKTGKLYISDSHLPHSQTVDQMGGPSQFFKE